MVPGIQLDRLADPVNECVALGCRAALRIVLLSAALLVSAPAAAEPPAREVQQFEVSPFIGYRVGGSFRLIGTGQHIELDDHGSFALALDARADESTQYELFYGRQSTVLRANALAPASIDVEYLHIGGTVALDEAQRVKPYLAGGLGITRFSPDPALGHEDTRFSVSLALGVRVPVSRHFSLRLEGRGLLTPVNTDSALFCRSDQSGALCQVRVRGSSFFQFDFLAGAAYSF
jgi:opacity protein-like surface antigen